MTHQRPIQTTLRHVRKRLAMVSLRHETLLTGLLLAGLATVLIWYEKSLYLSSPIRGIMALGLIDLALLLGLVVLIRWFGTWRGWWPWVSYVALAQRIGHRVDEHADRLLNAYQLENRLASEDALPNGDLLAESVRQVSTQLTRMPFQSLMPRRYRPPGRRLAAILAILALAWITDLGEMTSAAGRLAHANQDYPAPTPFILFSLTGDLEILGGDTARVEFSGFDVVPAEIELIWKDKAGASYAALLPLDGDRYAYYFEDLRDDITYYARYRNPSLFAPWARIITTTHRISISDRPILEDLQFTLTPPAYTAEPPETVGGNVSDMATLRGSRIEFSGRANLPLQDAWLNLGTEQLAVTIDGRRISGGFSLEKSLALTFSIVDRRNVRNLNPIRYNLVALEDFPPALTVLMPVVDVELDEAMLVPIQFDVTDDYGFSQAAIKYRIRHPDYLTQDDALYQVPLPGLRPDRRSQRVMFAWPLDGFDLMPGDEVHFFIEVQDNNLATGPGLATSNTLVARVPTLAALFAQVNERTEQTASVTEGVLEDFQKVMELLADLDLAVRQDEDISWEQQQSGKQLLQNLQEILQTMETVQDQLQDLGSKSLENDLFSESIQEKYGELQDLLQEIMNPELQSAMDNLRKALESLDPEKLRQALQNLHFQAAEFEAQLDRYLDIFRRAMAEMKMDEVARRLTELADTEELLLDQLAALPEGAEREMRDLAGRHRQQQRDLDAARNVMRSATNAIKPYSPEASERLNQMRSSPVMREAEQTLERASRSLEAGDKDTGLAELTAGAVSLRSLQREVQEIEEQFQSSNIKEMLARFQVAMNQALALSRRQEGLAAETAQMRRNSPRVGAMAERQHYLNQGHIRLTEQLIELSRQSFHITPDMGRSMGKARLAMKLAVEKLTGNNPPEAATAQGEGMAALNQLAFDLSKAMARMQQTGSASGYEEFLARMGSLSRGQQGLNAQTLSLQLGQMGAMSQLEMMRRLQARQRQLAEVLDQVLQGYSGQSGGNAGGLGQARQEMEDVIRDFQTRRLTRRTIDRQQRILNRLLDSQKSLTEQDFKDERTGRTPNQRFTYDGPTDLPADLGQREDLILQSLEKALRAGYSVEYQAMIRQYFRQLAARVGGRAP